MLKKSLKYDFRSLGRSSLPFIISSGVISVVCCALMFFTLSFSEVDSIGAALAIITGFYILGILAIVAMYFISCFFAVSRYYKSLFTDEGYLTMVIPAKTSVILGGKVIASAAWILSSTLVLILSLGVGAIAPILLYDPSMLGDIFFFSFDGISSGAVVGGIFNFVLSCISGVCIVFENIVLVFTAITVGSLVVRQDKILGSVLFYFVINFIHSIINSLLEMLLLGMFLQEVSAANYTLYILLEIFISIGIGIAMFFINYYCLKNKYNIE